MKKFAALLMLAFVTTMAMGGGILLVVEEEFFDDPPQVASLPDFAGGFVEIGGTGGGDIDGNIATNFNTVDLQGATLLVVSASRPGGTIGPLGSDPDNTWIPAFSPVASGTWVSNQLFYCTNPVTSATMRFGLTNGGSFSMKGWSNNGTAVFIGSSQAGGASSMTFQPGSITPRGTNLFVTGMGAENGAFSINSSFETPFTPLSEVIFNGIDLWSEISWKTSSVPENPTWGASGNVSGTASMIAFGAVAAAPPSGYTLIASTSKAGDANTVTTDAIDTRGATLIVVAKGFYQGTPTLSDSKSQSSTGAGTLQGAGVIFVQVEYYVNPTTDAAHTFTLAETASFPGLCVMAFTGNSATPFDVEDGSHANDTTTTRAAFNPIVPSVNGSLIIEAVTYGLNSFTATIDSGMSTPIQSVDAATLNFAMSYKVQGTAASINPTYTVSSGGTVASGLSLISFKPQ